MEEKRKPTTTKVGFYLRNESVAEVDLRHPEEGNPGVGGTHFNFVTLPYYLKRHNPNTVESVIYANAPELLPPELKTEQAASAVDAARMAERDGCHAIVFRPTERTREQNLLEALQSLNLKAIAWGHNVPLPLPHMDALAESESVSRFVVVGRERLDQIRDHLLFEKSRCIYNGFDPSAYIPEELTTEPPPTVAYVGSLVPPKGFHHLAEAWPEIKQRVPGARLIVVGSGRLYDRDTELGKWGVASENYEKEFRPYLSTEEGGVDPSVDFKGTLGTEKIPLMQEADVGVVNPTGLTENCPGSAIEFQAAGTPVVSIAEWGLLDTVKDGETGTLVRQTGELAGAVVDLLRDDEMRNRYAQGGIDFVEKKFPQKRICGQWVALFQRVVQGKPPKHEPIHQNYLYRRKWLRELMRKLKVRSPIFRKVPPLFKIAGERSLLERALRRVLLF